MTALCKSNENVAFDYSITNSHTFFKDLKCISSSHNILLSYGNKCHTVTKHGDLWIIGSKTLDWDQATHYMSLIIEKEKYVVIRSGGHNFTVVP